MTGKSNLSKHTVLLNAVFNKVLTKVDSGAFLKLDYITSKCLQIFFYNLRVEESKTATNYVDFLTKAKIPTDIALEDALNQLADLRIVEANYFKGGVTIPDAPVVDDTLATDLANKLFAFSYTPPVVTPPVTPEVGG